MSPTDSTRDLIPVPVPGASAPLMASEINGTPMAAFRLLCESVGVNADSQMQKLKSRSWARTALSTVRHDDGTHREMLFIDRRTMTMWLATLNENRVSDEARPTVIAFQAEAADALDAYFNEGGAINPSATVDQLDTIVTKAAGQMQLLRAAEGLVDPRFLESKARIIIARGLGEAPEIPEHDRPLYVQDYLRARGLSQVLIEAKQSGFGKRVKGRYMEIHGEPPKKHHQVVHGRPREVNAYTEADRPIFDHVWNTYYEGEVAA